MKNFWTEFKKFINKGNALNLAIAVVIGNAFTAITNNLVSGIITPCISILTGGISIDDWKVVLKPENTELGTAEISLKFGSVLQAIINFMIIALTIFIVVKIITKSQEYIKAKSDNFMAELNEKKAEKEMLKELKAKGVNIKDKAIRQAELERMKQEKLAKKLAEEAAVEPEPKPTVEVINDTLLEIRDLLKTVKSEPNTTHETK
ncbi:MAG: large conductance mechanosensitive channel protein MscL [Clostridia bacterium]|nr:large conductance mechanosensitive channel protein MscL [Clostridia bacterium]